MTTKSAKRFYKPGLDIVRFLAFILVFILHLSYMRREPGGNMLWVLRSAWVGLPLFFTLSSYLITELLLRERETTGSVHIKSFFARRALRIWPLYFGFLFAAFVWERLLPPHGFLLRALFAYTFLLGNWWSFFYGWVPIISAMWSISVEEQFYLIWPFAAKVLTKARLSQFCVITIVLGLAWIKYGTARSWRVELGSFTPFVYFATGGLLAIALHGRELVLLLWMRVAGLLFAGGTAIFADYRFHIVGGFASPNGAAVAYSLMAVSCVCVIVCLGGIRVSTKFKPLVYLGKISYGLYVFHLPVILVVRAEVYARHATATAFVCCALLSLTVTIALAATSYKFYEMPFLALKHRFTFVASRPD